MAGALLQVAAMAAFNAGAPLAVANVLAGATTAFVVNAVVATAASYAISVLTKPALAKPSDGQLEVKQPIPPLRIIYGRAKVSGPLGFIARTDESLPNLSKTVILAGHEIDAIEAHYLYGFPVSLDGAGVVYDAFFTGGDFFATVIPHLGTDDQLADDLLQGFFPGVWTSEHRGRGIAYSVVSFANPHEAEDIPKIFPQGPPEYQALVRGKKLYDPTKDTTNGGSGSHRMADKTTWEWSEEQRLIMLDYLTQPLCYEKGFARVDWATWIPQILRGREAVPLKAGGTEVRYRCSLAFHPAVETKTDVFARIRAAGDARIFFTLAGLIGCRGGAWDAPTVTLAADETAIEAEFGRVDRMDSYNVLNFKFLSPAHDYIEQPGDPWRDEASIVAEGEREREIDWMQVPSHAQARRLNKIAMARDNPLWNGTARTKLPGLQAIGEDAIDLSFAELDGGSGDFDGPYWVEGEIAADLATETVEFGLKAADPTSYDWNAVTEEGDAPPVPGVLPGVGGAAFLMDDADDDLMDDEDVDLIDEAA